MYTKVFLQLKKYHVEKKWSFSIIDSLYTGQRRGNGVPCPPLKKKEDKNQSRRCRCCTKKHPFRQLTNQLKTRSVPFFFYKEDFFFLNDDMIFSSLL